MTGQGVVWDQQYKQDRENQKEHRTCQHQSSHQKSSTPPSAVLNHKDTESTPRLANSKTCCPVVPLKPPPHRNPQGANGGRSAPQGEERLPKRNSGDGPRSEGSLSGQHQPRRNRRED